MVRGLTNGQRLYFTMTCPDALLLGGYAPEVGPVAVGLYSFSVAWILGKIIDKTMGFRIPIEDEVSGIDVVPYFLHTGRHVADDIPKLLDEGSRQHPDMQFLLARYLGSSTVITDILADRASMARRSVASDLGGCTLRSSPAPSPGPPCGDRHRR